VELRDRSVLVLGGAGLVGLAVTRRVLEAGPSRVVVASLRKAEADEALERLGPLVAEGTTLEGTWGDLFVPDAFRGRRRDEVLADPEARAMLIDDLYGELTPEVLERSALGRLLLDVEPDVVVDCINTAGALAYRNAFEAAASLRVAARENRAGTEEVEGLLATLYLPQLIRHAQIGLEGMKRAGTSIYVKIGTAGTGGMGLNIPFTHSEERPSRVLLAKASLAGAHTLMLFLMARTPGAPAVKEIKPTAAISWKSIGVGPVHRGGRPLERCDATGPVPVEDAFRAEDAWETVDAPIDGVYLDAGENGLFSLGEFETLTALGLMEFVTPEEIAENVIREIGAHPTGKDVVAALDAATMGPTYRAGVLRAQVLDRMEELEREHDTRAVAYEMLGPPRLAKLLFEATLLALLFDDVHAVTALDPETTAERAETLVRENHDLRQRAVSIGLPIFLPDGANVLRGRRVIRPPDPRLAPGDPSVVDAGWIDLRAANWTRWRGRVAALSDEIAARTPLDDGSDGDHEYGDAAGRLRPGRLAAWVLRVEDAGERVKR
jgi:NAD(P)-dependent dehydrogenase (short-subunit alcohol dehydrogenase family)